MMRRLIIFVALVALLSFAASRMTRVLLYEPSGRAGTFVVEPGESLRGVTRNLADQGYVRNARAVEIYGRAQGYGGRVQAGRYIVDRTDTPVRILLRIVGGDAVFDEITFTIPEGWSLSDIEAEFARRGLFSIEEFSSAAVMQPAYRDFPFLSELQDDTILDGYLFPDTYRVFADSTPETVVRRMLLNFQARVMPVFAGADHSDGRTLHEILTLASIVQAESGAGDMPDVAGVFTKRLRDGIPLESDATVNYVLGTNKLQPTFADTEVEHPYNTYENRGLPPGPIGNPGLEAILAALEPAENPYYFFLHKPDGEIVLSRTFAEHLFGKARYLD